jgi:excinuclease ABC subunit C
MSDERPHPPLPLALAPVLARIRAEAKNRPGVYRFTGPRGELLYVGKSVRVRARLLSWFRSADGKGLELLRVTRGVEWEYVGGAFEALLAEFRLIRALRPRYNVVHRRERRFAWVRLTAEPAPRILASAHPGRTRTRRGGRTGDRFFGPFPAHRSLPETLRDLAHVTGIRDCPAATPMRFADQGDLFGEPERSAPLCPRAELESCPAPCAGWCTEAEYAARVKEAVAFLEGRSDAPLERLDARMAEAAGRLAFEGAARTRDRRERLERLRDGILSTRRELERLTFVYRTGEPERHHLVVEGRVLLSFEPPGPGDPEGSAILGKRLQDLLGTAVATPRIRDPAAREERFLVMRWFRANPGERDRTDPVEGYLGRLETAAREDLNPTPATG